VRLWTRIGHRDTETYQQRLLLTLEDSMDAESARTEIERIAENVLTNPVIEEFTYRLEE